MAEYIPNRKEVIKTNMLIGLDITEVKNKLGYWWVCSNCNVNAFTCKGTYVFNRTGHGRLEVLTDKNKVVQVL